MKQQDFDIDAFQQQVLEDVRVIVEEHRKEDTEGLFRDTYRESNPKRLSERSTHPAAEWVSYNSEIIGFIFGICLTILVTSFLLKQSPDPDPLPMPAPDESKSPPILNIIFTFLIIVFGVSIGIPIVLKIVASFAELLASFTTSFGETRPRLSKARKKEAQAKQRLELVLTQAQDITQRPDFRSLVCPALQSVTNDVFEYSKILTPILIGAVLAKTIIMPLDTLLFAAIAVVVSRSGVSAMCANYPGKK